MNNLLTERQTQSLKAQTETAIQHFEINYSRCYFKQPVRGNIKSDNLRKVVNFWLFKTNGVEL